MIAPRIEDSIATIASAHAIEMAKALSRMTLAFRSEEAWAVQAEIDEVSRRLVQLENLHDSLVRQQGVMP